MGTGQLQGGRTLHLSALVRYGDFSETAFHQPMNRLRGGEGVKRKLPAKASRAKNKREGNLDFPKETHCTARVYRAREHFVEKLMSPCHVDRTLGTRGLFLAQEKPLAPRVRRPALWSKFRNYYSCQ